MGNLPSLSTWPEFPEVGHASLTFFVVLALGIEVKESMSDSGGGRGGFWNKKASHPGTTEPESEYVQRQPWVQFEPCYSLTLSTVLNLSVPQVSVYKLGLTASLRGWLGRLWDKVYRKSPTQA